MIVKKNNQNHNNKNTENLTEQDYISEYKSLANQREKEEFLQKLSQSNKLQTDNLINHKQNELEQNDIPLKNTINIDTPEELNSWSKFFAWQKILNAFLILQNKLITLCTETELLKGKFWGKFKAKLYKLLLHIILLRHLNLLLIKMKWISHFLSTMAILSKLQNQTKINHKITNSYLTLQNTSLINSNHELFKIFNSDIQLINSLDKKSLDSSIFNQSISYILQASILQISLQNLMIEQQIKLNSPENYQIFSTQTQNIVRNSDQFFLLLNNFVNQYQSIYTNNFNTNENNLNLFKMIRMMISYGQTQLKELVNQLSNLSEQHISPNHLTNQNSNFRIVFDNSSETQNHAKTKD